MLETGVPNLDLILGGGIPRGDVLLVFGPAGSGKTTISLQIAFHTAASGQNVLYVSTLSEPPTRLVQHIRSFSYFDEALLGKRLFLVSLYPLVKQGLEAVTDGLVRAVKEHQAALVILDGFMTLRDLYPAAPALRAFVYELGATLATLECTTVMTSGATPRDGERQFPEVTMVDGVLELGMHDLGGQTVRTIRPSKMRGLAPLLGQHALRIDHTGAKVFPRICSVPHPADVRPRTERVPLGVPELDAMMSGGPRAGSVTMLTGTFGTGKTLVCLQYVMEGVRRGERGVFIGFRETPLQLMDKASAFGMDLAAAVEAGHVALLYRSPVDLVLDEATWELLEQVRAFAPRRLALDSICELEQAIAEEQRRRAYLAGLVGVLRQQEITSLVTREIAQVVGTELDFREAPLSVLAENVILFRQVEFRSELYRIVSILKARDSRVDQSIRQYVIEERGIRVMDRMEAASDLLTGVAHVSSEWRVKRPGG